MLGQADVKAPTVRGGKKSVVLESLNTRSKELELGALGVETEQDPTKTSEFAALSENRAGFLLAGLLYRFLRMWDRGQHLYQIEGSQNLFKRKKTMSLLSRRYGLFPERAIGDTGALTFTPRSN